MSHNVSYNYLAQYALVHTYGEQSGERGEALCKMHGRRDCLIQLLALFAQATSCFPDISTTHSTKHEGIAWVLFNRC